MSVTGVYGEASPTTIDGVVREDGSGLFVEADGRRFESEELFELRPEEGTAVSVEPYLRVGDVRSATIRWTSFESTYVIHAVEAS